MIKKGLPVTFALAVSLMAIAGFQLINLANCPLTVVVNSPQNKTYTTSDIFVFMSAADPEMQIGPEAVAYSLDGAPLVIIREQNLGLHSLDANTTLSLPDGSHNIVGIAITWFGGTVHGNFSSPTVYFTVDTSSASPKPSPSPSPSPATSPRPSPCPTLKPDEELEQTNQRTAMLGAVITAVVVGAGLGLLIYLLKRR